MPTNINKTEKYVITVDALDVFIMVDINTPKDPTNIVVTIKKILNSIIFFKLIPPIKRVIEYTGIEQIIRRITLLTEAPSFPKTIDKGDILVDKSTSNVCFSLSPQIAVEANDGTINKSNTAWIIASSVYISGILWRFSPDEYDELIDDSKITIESKDKNPT